TAGSVLGSTGHWPVPSRDSPDGIGVTAAATRRNTLGLVPVDGSPTGAGGSPAPPTKAKRNQNTSIRLDVNTEFAWDADYLYFTVRQPFPTKKTGASLVFGRVTAQQPLIIESQMGENGVIFSDGIEQDFLEFNSGTRAVISIAERKGLLV